MLFKTMKKGGFGAAVGLLSVLLAAPYASAVLIERNPVQGAGIVTVDMNGLPLILGAPIANSPLEIDVVFEDMKHIEILVPGATADIEFGVGNTGNQQDLDYRIVFDLSDMNGNLITQDLLVVNGVATGGTINIVALDLTELPVGIFHDFHITVETQLLGSTMPGNGLFDLFVAGGAGLNPDPASVTGPITFTRAVVGVWTPGVPEPLTASLSLMGLGVLGMATRRRVA